MLNDILYNKRKRKKELSYLNRLKVLYTSTEINILTIEQNASSNSKAF